MPVVESLTIIGSVDSLGRFWITPMAIAPIVAAAASGIHQRHGSRASATAGFEPTARCAAARIASSSAAGGVSRACSRTSARPRRR
ncbi:MAG: hypothetical protein IPI87_07865 [Betaproteobacteria bacterium]|nr:hypothetical protein [Betaproteobacteria bacterium]